MCHARSTAPQPPLAVRQDQRHTSGPESVPYLAFEAKDSNVHSRDQMPHVVIATDIFGISPFYRHLAALLAEQGYRVLVPDMFHRVGEARDSSREAAFERRALLDDNRAVADLEQIIDETGNGTRRFGILGFCIGGSFALLTAVTRPQQVTVTYYGFPRGAPGATKPTREPLDVANQITGPVLGFWGRKDYIDAGEVDQLEAALARSPGEHHVLWYEQAGHSFLAGLTENEHDSAEAATDSWRRTLTFFDSHLRSPTSACTCAL